MSHELWAVVCGNLRDELDFKLTMSKLVELRNNQKIKHIVLSTWRGEINKFPRLREALNEANIFIIESWEMDKTLEKAPTGSVNYWRQAQQMLAALEIIPRNAFILKARTDRSLNYLNQLDKINFFDHYAIETKKIGNFPNLFKYKISVFSPKMVRILHMIDFVLIGHWRDLYKLINFEVAELGSRKMVVANLQWFYKPFVHEFPILRSYYQFTIYNNTIKTLRNYVDKYKNDAKFPEIYYKIYALYFLILYTHFNIISTRKFRQEDPNLSFYHCFTTTPNRNMVATPLGNSIKNNEIISKYIDGDFYQDYSHAKITHYVRELIRDGFTENFDLLYDDYSELVGFDKENIFEKQDINCLKRLRNPPLRPRDIMRKKKDVSTYRFKCLSISDPDWKNLYHTVSLENDLLSKWIENIENGTIQDAETTIKMLLPSAKAGNEKAIYILLDMLNHNMINELNFNEVVRVAEFYIDLLISRKQFTDMTKRNFLLLLRMIESYKNEKFNYLIYFKILFESQISQEQLKIDNYTTVEELKFDMYSLLSSIENKDDRFTYISDLNLNLESDFVFKVVKKFEDSLSKILFKKNYLNN